MDSNLIKMKSIKHLLLCEQDTETKEKTQQVDSALIIGKYSSHYFTFEYLEF